MVLLVSYSIPLSLLCLHYTYLLIHTYYIRYLYLYLFSSIVSSGAGVRNGNHLGDARRHFRHRHSVHRYGAHYSFHIRPLVHVLRPGLLHSLPSASHGGSLQTPLQHVRLASGLHYGVPGPSVWWGATVGPVTLHLLSGL